MKPFARTDDWRLIAASFAFFEHNHISFEGIEAASRDDEADFVNMASYSPPNPEQGLIRKEEWDKLGWEAKQVIELVVNCPAEIFDEMCPGATRITFAKLHRYLLRLFGKGREARLNKAYEEIRQYVAETL